MTAQREDALAQRDEFMRQAKLAQEEAEHANQARLDAEVIAKRYKTVAEHTHQAVVQQGIDQRDLASRAGQHGDSDEEAPTEAAGDANPGKPAAKQRLSLEARQLARLEQYRAEGGRSKVPVT